MIFDTLTNMKNYVKLMPELVEIEKFIREFMKGDMEIKRYDLDGDNLFVSPATYVPKDHEGAEYESHAVYADVQVVIKGREYIGFAPLEDCTVTKPFEEGGDIAFYTSEKGSLCLIEEGYFLILYPQDAHMPSLKVKDGEEVTKLVFKVKLGE
ncbi:MAG: DUF386 domain-containing protein [Ruminococcaceae bacterium]|nr:DUF386 domain-containing protein [Oscillospiraceae bacterium]MBP3330253.1 YhcH/YjgK/YiaL family protein [Clostridia bacterium]